MDIIGFLGFIGLLDSMDLEICLEGLVKLTSYRVSYKSGGFGETIVMTSYRL